jgi:hypothetical protein
MKRFLFQSLLFVSLFFVLSIDSLHITINNKTKTNQTINLEYRLDQFYNHPHKPQKAFVPLSTNHYSQNIAPSKTILFTLFHPQTCTHHCCSLDTNLKNDEFIPYKKRINILLSTTKEDLFKESSLLIENNQTITCTLLKDEIKITTI